MKRVQNENKILHLALTAGSLIIVLVIAFLLKPVLKNTQPIDFDLLAIVGLAFFLLAIFNAYVVFPKKYRALGSNDQSYAEKLRTLYVSKWSLLEGACLINAVLYYVSANRLLIALAITLVMVLYINKPKVFVDGVEQ